MQLLAETYPFYQPAPLGLIQIEHVLLSKNEPARTQHPAHHILFGIQHLSPKFFLSYQNIDNSGVPIRLEAKMGEYLSLMMRFIFAFGLAFQLPVVLGLMAKVGIVTHTSLKKFRKYAIVIAFLAAAFLTPPDPFSQISLALPD